MDRVTQTGQQSSVLCTFLSSFTSSALTSGRRDKEKKTEDEKREGGGEKITSFTKCMWVQNMFTTLVIICFIV